MDLDPREVIECGKVGPGEVLVVDTARGEVIRNLDAKREIAGRRPYARWVARYMATLVPDPARVPPAPEGEDLARAPARASATAPKISASCSSRWAATGGRSGLEHGRRHADPAALGGAAERLRLLPAALRAGDQPADRFAARIDGDVAPDAPRPARLARCWSGRRTPGCSGWSTRILLDEEMAALRNVAGFSTVTLDAVWDVSEGRRWAPAGAHRAPPRGRAGGAAGRAHHRHQRPGRGRDATRRSRCCSRSARCASTWCTPACAPGSASWRRRATRSTSTTSRR